MTTFLPIPHERFEQIRAEHDEICDLIATLYRVFAERHEPENRVACLMVSLKELIVEQFDDEQDSGLFDNLRRIAPHKADSVSVLEREHAQLVERMDRLCRLADQDEYAVDLWEQLEFDFRAFGTAFGHHESRENEHLLDVYEQGVGNHA